MNLFTEISKKLPLLFQGRWRRWTSSTSLIKMKVRWQWENGLSTSRAQSDQEFSMSLVWNCLEQGVYVHHAGISFHQLKNFPISLPYCTATRTSVFMFTVQCSMFNFVLVGLPVYLQRRLQSILNAAARLVFRLRRYDHVTDSLAIKVKR